ncbi:hypothetical protein KP509_06G037600 [Ceratopteris richardii]|uniref:Uncharacterized protein n=1 Tax=Ceratopteris richardii TaxID=49495 RepID=A0A8T2UFK8_CERRI|nr:hypothetical protein KP509_06G037600 [Ceratopteris richardii]
MARGKRSRARDEVSEDESAGVEEGKFEREMEKSEDTMKVDEENSENRGSIEDERDGVAKELLLSRCKSVLRIVMDYKHAWLFNEPVDPVALDIPDYPLFVKHPMDLGTVKNKLDKKQYKHLPADFISDVRLTFENAMLYNPPGHDVNTAAKRMLKMFEKEWDKGNSKSVASSSPRSVGTSTPKIATPKSVKSTAASTPKSAALSTSKLPKRPRPDKAYSFEEKQTLLQNLQTLAPRMQHAAVLLIRDQSPNVDWSGEEVDVQLDLLDNSVIQELEEHINKCMKSASSSNRKVHDIILVSRLAFIMYFGL